MGKFYDEIPDEKIVDFIRDQKLFHVATAPLNGGHVNVSPRAYRSFKLVNSRACWFMDLSGSGNETISHLYEPGNGRITIMFEAFEGPPNIVRLYGKGTVYERDTPEFNKFFDSPDEDGAYNFPSPELLPGARAVIWIDITRVSTSCGYSVPFMQFLREREQLAKENTRLEANDAAVEDPYTLPPTRGLKKFWVLGNTWSIDGLPGLKNNLDKADPEGQRMVMRTFGLKDLEPPSAAHVAGIVKTRTTQTPGEVFMLLVGALLGALAMIVAQRRLS